MPQIIFPQSNAELQKHQNFLGLKYLKLAVLNTNLLKFINEIK